MQLLQFPFFVSLFVCVVSLAHGYSAGEQEWAARWVPVFGGVWAFAQVRRWPWFSSIGLFAALAAAGWGLWIGLSIGWMLAGALGALFAWDLSDFERRLRDSVPEDAPALAHRHLSRLGVLASLGLGWSLLGMLFWRHYSLDWFGYAAILAALAISLLIGRMRHP